MLQRLMAVRAVDLQMPRMELPMLPWLEIQVAWSKLHQVSSQEGRLKLRLRLDRVLLFLKRLVSRLQIGLLITFRIQRKPASHLHRLLAAEQ
jgi:hypothetical protein